MMSFLQASTGGSVGTGLSSFATTAVNRQSDSQVHGGDWTKRLPSTWLASMDSIVPGYSWPSKVRFVESIIFAGSVAFFVFRVAGNLL